MRLLLDADLSPRRIGKPLEQRGHDVRSVAGEPILDGLEDAAVLELATHEKRVLITRNSRDFSPLCRTWAEAGRDHAGVILIWSSSSRQFGEIVRGVERWLDEIATQEAWRGKVVSI